MQSDRIICEQAGGIATNGYKNILDIEPELLHQRTPFIVEVKNGKSLQKFI